MKKRKFPLLLVLGACLVLLSLSWMLITQLRMYTGARQAAQILAEINSILPEKTVSTGLQADAGAMPALQIGGTDYVALLEIPSWGITLPVADRWDSGKLYRCPARFTGSAADSTLIIGGADDPRQFGFCDRIGQGTVITLTDMTGQQYTYTVADVDRAKHAQAQWLTGAPCDLTLFCHDIYSMEYIAVRCVLTYH